MASADGGASPPHESTTAAAAAPAANDDINIMRILVATDNHLGYMEKDPIRGEDSFKTFEEILQKAQEYEVDFILLGGDLFHDNKPSRKTLYKTMELLRTYCLGDKPVSVELLSDPKKNFANKFGVVNYQDPNYNVAIPVFSIHGNHDDPAGDAGLAALDILSVANLVNYFGKSDNIDDVTIFPVLLRKGITHVAIYGLGNIRDERLYRTWQQKKVRFMRPVENQNAWFNIFVLHQNRVAHNPKALVHEAMIDPFLDFVIWGHEHECLAVPQRSAIHSFYITQPGSSIATSLSEGEAKKKHIGILEIRGDQFRFRPVALATVRPFVIDDVVLADYAGEAGEVDPQKPESVSEFLARRVDELIERANAEYASDHPSTSTSSQTAAPMIPLVRLRVDYSGGFPTVNPQRFGQRFVGKVANPNELLLFHRKRGGSAKSAETIAAAAAGKIDEDDLLRHRTRTVPEPLDTTRIEDLLESFLGVDSSLAGDAGAAAYLGGPRLLPEREFAAALHLFVEKDEPSAIGDFVARTLDQTRKYLGAKENVEATMAPEGIEELVIERTNRKRAEAAALEASQAAAEADDVISGPTTSDGSVKGADKSSANTAAANDDDDFINGHVPPCRRTKTAAAVEVDSDGHNAGDVIDNEMLTESSMPPSKARTQTKLPFTSQRSAATATAAAAATPTNRRTPASSAAKKVSPSPTGDEFPGDDYYESMATPVALRRARTPAAATTPVSVKKEPVANESRKRKKDDSRDDQSGASEPPRQKRRIASLMDVLQPVAGTNTSSPRVVPKIESVADDTVVIGGGGGGEITPSLAIAEPAVLKEDVVSKWGGRRKK